MIPYFILNQEESMKMVMQAGPALTVLLLCIVLYACCVNVRAYREERRRLEEAKRISHYEWAHMFDGEKGDRGER